MSRTLCRVAAAVALLAPGCRRAGEGAGPVPTAGVVYRVMGSARDVQIHHSSLGLASMSSVRATQLPWQVVFGPERPMMLMVTAMTPETGVSLSCEIWVDGRRVAQASSTGGVGSPASCMTSGP